MGLFCNSFCDEVCGVWVLQFLWPVLYHWAVDEGRLDEVSLFVLWQWWVESQAQISLSFVWSQ